MNCLPCLRGKKSDGENSENKEDAELLPVAQPKDNQISKQPSASVNNEDIEKQDEDGAAPAGSASTFKFQELASATKNFNQECLLGESGFGKVYKGTLADGKVVAVKQLDTQRTKGNKEFIKEVTKLSELHHPSLVELFGYCADGDHRLLVYEYMQMGSIKDHLHDLPPGKKPLDWITRMKAAAGAAKAIEYLHEKINPPVLCRNIKSTNVLLDENFKPKVGDYGLVNLESSSGGSEQKRVMGTVGELTLKSDVYSFGVIILELITGRKALDTSRPTKEQDLVSWAQPYFKDPHRFHELADPIFKGVVPENILSQALRVASRCLQEDSGVRPLISEIVGALKVAPPEGFLESSTSPTSAPPKKYPSSSSSSSSSSSDSEHELDFKIEPFNRPEPQSEPQPQSQPESAHESEQEHEWESDPETETEPEPEPEPEPDLDTDSDSESESDTESEPEPVEVFKPEPVFEPEVSTSHKDQTDSDSDSDSDSESEAEQVAKPEPVVEPEASTSHKDQPDSDHDSNSTSGSIYDEDAYSEEDFSDEDKPNTSILINSRSKARMKTKLSKKKVMFKTEETDSIKPSMQRVNSSYNKKSKDDDQSISNSNNQPIKRKNTGRTRKSDSRRDDTSDIESTDESDDEFEPQRFKSTISRFNAESRCYSSYQDETVLTSTSDNEK